MERANRIPRSEPTVTTEERVEPASEVSASVPNSTTPPIEPVVPGIERPDWPIIRSIVDSRYDVQRLRIAVGHRRLRILRSWVVELREAGMDHAQIAKVINTTRIDRVYPPQTITEREVREIDEELRKEMEDEAAKSKADPTYHPRHLYSEIHATRHTDELFFLYGDLVAKEVRIERYLKPFANSTVTGRWLLAQRGIGPVLACGLLAYFDPEKANHPSSYWRFAGIGVMDGHAERLVAAKIVHPKKGPCKECDCPKYAEDEASEHDDMCTCGHPLKVAGERAHFSKTAKFLVFNVATSFIKQGSPFKTVYDASKVKYLERWGTKNGQKDHAHKAAMRVMAKRFLIEFWKVGRAEAGLSVGVPYIFGPGGHTDPEPDIGTVPDETDE